MRWKPLVAALFVVLLVVPSPALGVVRGSPELNVGAPDNRFIAGQDAQFQVTVTNEGNLDTGSVRNPALNSEVTTARAVRATLEADGAPVEVRTGSRLLSQLPQGQAVTLPYGISVAEDAAPGTYEMELHVRYRHTSVIGENTGVRNERTVNRTFDVTVVVQERAQFEVVDVASDVQVGSTGTVELTMRNDGNDVARSTTVSIESPNSDLVIGQANSASRFVGDWAPGETKTVEYEVRATGEAEQQRYTVRATASFEDDDGIPRQSEALPFAVTPSPQTSFALQNVSSDLRVGEEGTLRGTVVNTADSRARDAVVRLTTQNENAQPAERTYSVGTLAPGEAADFSYSIEVSEGAEAGPRQFSFVVEFRGDSDTTRTSDTLNAREFVRPETETFAVEVIQGSVRTGGSSHYEVRLTNQGNETLTDISAKLFADSPISAGDDEAYVSRLEPGASTTLTFTVSAGSALAKDYPVSMDFQYDDADGDTLLSNTYRRAVTVTQPEGGGGGFPFVLVGGGALVAVLGVGAYLRLR